MSSLVSTCILRKIAKRNGCSVNGNKQNIAKIIWSVCYSALNSEDINMILPFLEKKIFITSKKTY